MTWKWQHRAANARNVQALTLYSSLFDDVIYQCAVHGKSTAYACALVDEAWALCGAPSYKIGNRLWGEEAKAFLSLFL